MGAPVAETLGMKTGAAGHSDLEATSTGNEARFSSTKPRSRPASPREGIAAVGDLGASVAVAAARSPMGLPTCLSCRCNLAAPDAADQLRRRRRQRSAMNAIANGNPRESSATRRASFSNVRCDLQRRQRNVRDEHGGMHDRCGGKPHTGRSGRAQRPPLARTEHETSGRLSLALRLRLKAVQLSHRALRMGRSGEDRALIVGESLASLPHRPLAT